MLRKISIAAVFVLFLVLSLMIPAFGGGWAVVTLDHLPEQVIADKPVSIDFMLRGHGVTPVTTDGLSIEAHHLESSERLSASAVSGDSEGHYTAVLTFPRAGAWEWGVSMGPYSFIQSMPTLDVLPAELASPADVRPSSASLIPALWTAAGVSLALAVGLLLRRKPIRWAAALAASALVAGSLGMAISAYPASGAFRNPEHNLPGPEYSMAVSGADLFVAKGCVICHTHGDIPAKYVDFQIGVGPNLTNYSAAPAFLELWLSDPAGVKPKTQMPNLELSEAEIGALISFLNSES
jgi:mono/diheme cytochrome c family protein